MYRMHGGFREDPAGIVGSESYLSNPYNMASYPYD